MTPTMSKMFPKDFFPSKNSHALRRHSTEGLAKEKAKINFNRRIKVNSSAFGRKVPIIQDDIRQLFKFHEGPITVQRGKITQIRDVHQAKFGDVQFSAARQVRVPNSIDTESRGIRPPSLAKQCSAPSPIPDRASLRTPCFMSLEAP